MLFVSMLDFIGYAPIFVDFSGRFNNRAIRMIEYLSNTGSPLASKSFGLIRCYSGECGYVAILFSQLSHRHILLQIHPFAKIFTEVTSPKTSASAIPPLPQGTTPILPRKGPRCQIPGDEGGLALALRRFDRHQPAFTCRFAILPTSPTASGDHPVKTVTSLIFWNPSPA